ncbi:MAG: hypothetical protein HY834_01365 [Devosia nanyangense]|uniref:DUF3828 domain-containing protein n=1 Tax=Devosia nanyangense TaxID=1228055 RepID=A0A933KZC0_9HYPH|nr:hypothetical protein [Devosia nanyangense]
MRTLAALAFLACLTAPAAAASLEMANGYGAIDAPRNIDPARLGQLFCASRIAGDMAPLAPFLAPKLTRLIDSTPESAVPWQGFPDRPQRCDIAIVNGFADTIGVLVRLTYVADSRKWSDTLNLERTPDSWLLNNVFYDGGGNLRFRLLETTN